MGRWLRYLLATLLILTSSCGASRQPMTEEGLKEAARADLMARFARDHDSAFNAYTEECQRKIGRDAVVASIRRGLNTYQSLASPVELKDVHVTDVSVRDFKQTSGEARVQTDNEGVNTVAVFWAWSYEEGRWRRGCDVPSPALPGSYPDYRVSGIHGSEVSGQRVYRVKFFLHGVEREVMVSEDCYKRVQLARLSPPSREYVLLPEDCRPSPD